MASDEIEQLLKNGEKLKAIQLLVKDIGMSLKEAKEYADCFDAEVQATTGSGSSASSPNRAERLKNIKEWCLIILGFSILPTFIFVYHLCRAVLITGFTGLVVAVAWRVALLLVIVPLLVAIFKDKMNRHWYSIIVSLAIPTIFFYTGLPYVADLMENKPVAITTNSYWLHDPTTRSLTKFPYYLKARKKSLGIESGYIVLTTKIYEEIEKAKPRWSFERAEAILLEEYTREELQRSSETSGKPYRGYILDSGHERMYAHRLQPTLQVEVYPRSGILHSYHIVREP